MAHNKYEYIAASATDQVLGVTGAVGDLLDVLLVAPASTSPGAVTIKDGNGAGMIVYAGDAAKADATPFAIVFSHGGIRAKTTGGANNGWSVTTGANVTVVAIGRFTD